MSPSNIDRLHPGVEHFRQTGEPLWEQLDPEVEIHDHNIPDAGGVYRGHDGRRGWMADIAGALESFAVEPEEYIDGGDGKVVLVARLSARGRGSGVPLERRYGLVWTIRDGKTVRWRAAGRCRRTT